MCEEMLPLLNVYLDGELHGIHLMHLEEHLVTCASCREELEQLRRLSDLLHALPTPQFIPVDRFVANLSLNLPRRSSNARPPRYAAWIWWLVPTGLVFAWFFVQTVLILSGTISLANATNLLGNATAWLSGGTQHTLWFDAMSSVLGSQAGSSPAAFSFLDQLSVFGANLLMQIFWQGVIVLLFWAWLAVWWISRRSQLVQSDASHQRS